MFVAVVSVAINLLGLIRRRVPAVTVPNATMAPAAFRTESVPVPPTMMDRMFFGIAVSLGAIVTKLSVPCSEVVRGLRRTKSSTVEGRYPKRTRQPKQFFVVGSCQCVAIPN